MSFDQWWDEHQSNYHLGKTLKQRLKEAYEAGYKKKEQETKDWAKRILNQ